MRRLPHTLMERSRRASRDLIELSRHIQEGNAGEIETLMGTDQVKNAARQVNANDLELLWCRASRELALSDKSTLIFMLAELFPNTLLKIVSLSRSSRAEAHIPLSIALNITRLSKAGLEKMMAVEPRTATTRIGYNGGGYLLHGAARNLAAATECLQLIYDAYSQAVEIKDYYGNLPIHAALYSRSSNFSKEQQCACAQFLLRKYPAGALKPNSQDKTPLELAISPQRSWEVFEVVLRHCGPKPNFVKAASSRSPLAMMCNLYGDRGGVDVNNKLSLLLTMHPEAALQRDEHNRIPFQNIDSMELANEVRNVLFRKSEPHIGEEIARLTDSEDGSNILHLLCAFVPRREYDYNKNDSKEETFVHLFATQCRDLALARNYRGQLSLHLRLDARCDKQDVYYDVKALLSVFPESAGQPEPEEHILPFMQAAKGAGACVKTTCLLLQQFLMYHNIQDISRAL
jgi:hypothetical protein